jgi:hypothetical protein
MLVLLYPIYIDVSGVCAVVALVVADGVKGAGNVSVYLFAHIRFSLYL